MSLYGNETASRGTDPDEGSDSSSTDKRDDDGYWEGENEQRTEEGSNDNDLYGNLDNPDRY